MIDALLFSIGSVHYEVRVMTRSIASKAAQELKRDYPQVSLFEWQQEDTDSIRQCFEGCYGAFITTAILPLPESSLQELSRDELDLGKRCLEAATVNHFSIRLREYRLSVRTGC